MIFDNMFKTFIMLFVAMISLLSIASGVPRRIFDQKKTVSVSFSDEIHDACTTPDGSGLCMYQWECSYTGGVPIGICKHGFQFGACCVHDEGSNEVATIPTTEKPGPSTKSPVQLESIIVPGIVSIDTTNSTGEEKTDIIESHSQQKCGVSTKIGAPSARIVNGTRATIGEFPWQVSIMLFKGIGKGFEHHCGGVLLNERWVVTAAHCLVRILLAELQVRIGEYDLWFDDLRLPHQDIKVRKKVLHPEYRLNSDSVELAYENDIALLQLKEPVKFKKHVAPICLPASSGLLVGDEAVVTGWGRLEENGTTTNILQKVFLPILSNKECENLYSKAGLEQNIPDIFLCAGFSEGGYDACNGDSGGPLQTKSQDGRYVLSGIVSWGNGCGEPNKPGVYTRTSKYVSWILETVALPLK